MWLVHRIDSDDRLVARFPRHRVPDMAERLQRFRAELRPTGVVSAAASGADLLMLDTARELGLPICVVLPLPVDDFRRRSVADQGDEWLAPFGRVLPARLRPSSRTSPHDDWYLRGNDVILARRPGRRAGPLARRLNRPECRVGGSAPTGQARFRNRWSAPKLCTPLTP